MIIIMMIIMIIIFRHDDDPGVVVTHVYKQLNRACIYGTNRVFRYVRTFFFITGDVKYETLKTMYFIHYPVFV